MTFKKDNKTYFFNSKYEKLNHLYQITKEDKKIVDEKIKNQEDYLKSHVISFHDNDLTRSLHDLSYGANIKPEIYFSEMNNRVNTLLKYSKEIKFSQPIFITLTAKSEHKPLKSISIGKNRFKMIDNPRFNGSPEHVTEAREYLSESWTLFTCKRVFKDIKEKYGERYVYMKTYEPTLDGVPHLHALLFVPPEFKDRVIKAISASFKTSRHDIKTDFDDDVGGVVAYIMKYILKSFKNAKENKLDDVGYWYAKNRILRFTTSRSLLPLSIYRLIKGKEIARNYLEMSKKYKNGFLNYSYVQKDFYNFDSNLKRKDYHITDIYLIDDDYLTYEHKLLYSRNDSYEIDFFVRSTHHKIKYVPFKSVSVPIFNSDNEKIGYFDGVRSVLFSTTKTPEYLNNVQLYKYYYSLDVETVNLQHYGHVKNVMIDRGLLNEKKQFLNDYLVSKELGF